MNDALLRDEKINVSAIKSDNDTAMKGMKQQLEANAQLRRKCIDILTYINCFKKYLSQTNSRKLKRLKKYRAFIDVIGSYEPVPAEFEAARQKEDALFNSVKMFKTNSTGEA